MYWNENWKRVITKITRLTLTWDVLKFYKRHRYYISKCRLTLTWDVLKYCKCQQ